MLESIAMRKDLYKVTFWYEDKTADVIWLMANNAREALYTAKLNLEVTDFVSYEITREMRW